MASPVNIYSDSKSWPFTSINTMIILNWKSVPLQTVHLFTYITSCFTGFLKRLKIIIPKKLLVSIPDPGMVLIFP